MPPDHPASESAQPPGGQPDRRRGFRIADWDVHPLKGVIEQGGHRVHIEPKVMDVLLCLVAHQGEVVTRDTLLNDVWHGVVVTDDVVTRCISELRTVLRDTGRDRQFIRTIPKRGYSLMVPVEPLNDAQRAPATTRRLVRPALLGIGLIIVTIVALAVLFSDGDDGAPIKVTVEDDRDPSASAASATPAPSRRYQSVAVLPLVNLSGNPEHEYFSDGLAEDIRNALISATDLRVAARTSSMAFLNRPMDVREIARQLNVEALLEGTVRITDSKLRVTAQVTDGRTGYPIWASSFERPVTDKLALQSEVAEAIIRQIAPSIAAGNSLLASATGNDRAHDAYLLGRYYWNQRTQESIERSIGYFEQALVRDPDYALAYSGLADAWSLSIEYGDRPAPDAKIRANEYARKALALNPNLAEAHASLGMVLNQSGDLEGALAEYQAAVELQPGYAMAQMWLGTLLLGMDDAIGASQRLEAALALDPLHPSVQVNHVSTLVARGQLDRAREEARRLLTLTPNHSLQKMLLHVSLEKGDFVDVLELAIGQTSGSESRLVFGDAVIKALIYLQRYDETARIIADNRKALSLPHRLSLDAALAVARRDVPALRRAATELIGPAAVGATPDLQQACARQVAGLWLGIASFLEGREAVAQTEFLGVASALAPLHCGDDAPALALIARAYALESAARQGITSPPEDLARARTELERLRKLGWNDASFRMAEMALALIEGDEEKAVALLRNSRRSGLHIYGPMRASPLFDRLWALPPLKDAEPAMAAEFKAAQERAADLKLAKLGL